MATLTFDDALEVLRHWQTEGTLLSSMFRLRQLSLTARLRVSTVSVKNRADAALVLVSDDGVRVGVDLGSALEFRDDLKRFDDPRPEFGTLHPANVTGRRGRRLYLSYSSGPNALSRVLPFPRSGDE